MFALISDYAQYFYWFVSIFVTVGGGALGTKLWKHLTRKTQVIEQMGVDTKEIKVSLLGAEPTFDNPYPDKGLIEVVDGIKTTQGQMKATQDDHTERIQHLERRLTSSDRTASSIAKDASKSRLEISKKIDALTETQE